MITRALGCMKLILHLTFKLIIQEIHKLHKLTVHIIFKVFIQNMHIQTVLIDFIQKQLGNKYTVPSIILPNQLTIISDIM